MPWNNAVVKCCVLDLSRAMTSTVSVLSVWGFRMHARRFMGFLNANFAKISISKPSALGLRCLKRSHQRFPVASAAYSELMDVRSSRWIGPTSPVSLKLRNSTSGSLAAQIPGLNGGSCCFSAICIRRSPDPGNNRFPPVLLTRQLLTSPTFGFCGAGLHRHACGRGHFGLPPFTLFGAFLEVPPPPSD